MIAMQKTYDVTKPSVDSVRRVQRKEHADGAVAKKMNSMHAQFSTCDSYAGIIYLMLMNASPPP